MDLQEYQNLILEWGEQAYLEQLALQLRNNVIFSKDIRDNLEGLSLIYDELDKAAEYLRSIPQFEQEILSEIIRGCILQSDKVIRLADRIEEIPLIKLDPSNIKAAHIKLPDGVTETALVSAVSYGHVDSNPFRRYIREYQHGIKVTMGLYMPGDYIITGENPRHLAEILVKVTNDSDISDYIVGQ